MAAQGLKWFHDIGWSCNGGKWRDMALDICGLRGCPKGCQGGQQGCWRLVAPTWAAGQAVRPRLMGKGAFFPRQLLCAGMAEPHTLLSRDIL